MDEYAYAAQVISTSAIGQALVSMLTICIGALILVYLFGKIFTKSRTYRKLMADMYVVGKTKQIAEKDNIDLVDELKEFAKFMKQKDIDCGEELDTTIEKELQAKIANVSTDKPEKK